MGSCPPVYHQRKENARPVGNLAMAAQCWLIRRANVSVITADAEARKSLPESEFVKPTPAGEIADN
jgi:hypothetical protein